MKNILNRSDVRIAVLDLEASALGIGSYPIEVGVALIQPAGHPIRTWSTMIRPTEAWLSEGLWSSASAGVHGIPLDLLQQEGHVIGDVCDWLNAILSTRTIVATDAPRYDQDWLDTLFKAAGREQRFILYDYDLLTGALGSDQYRHFVYLLDRDPAPHRAGPDALRLASRLMEAHLGYPPRAEPLEHPPCSPDV